MYEVKIVEKEREEGEDDEEGAEDRKEKIVIQPDLEEAKKLDPYYDIRKEVNAYNEGLRAWNVAKPDAKGRMTIVKPRLSNSLLTRA